MNEPHQSREPSSGRKPTEAFTTKWRSMSGKRSHHPLAAGVAFSIGIVLSPAIGAALMSLSTVIVAINAKLLDRAKALVTDKPSN